MTGWVATATALIAPLSRPPGPPQGPTKIEHLSQLHAHLLRPLGIDAVPTSIDAAVDAFVARRNELEAQFGMSVGRALEDEVRRGIDRVLHDR